MEKIYVSGHKVPDTDSICSAIAYAQFLKDSGQYDAQAIRLGEISRESQFVLDTLEVAAPPLVEALEAGTAIALVDHNERGQAIDGIEELDIRQVVDHHRIANFETKGPVFYRAEPVGCTATIVSKLYRERGLTPDETTAGLLTSAILSDTLYFRSPTTTQEDREALDYVSKLAGLNVDDYADRLFKAGTSLEGMSAQELISADAKEFNIDGKLARVAQVMTADLASVEPVLPELMEAMDEVRKETGAQTFVLMVTDIFQETSKVLVSGDYVAGLASAFESPLEGSSFMAPGLLSRKKQMIPKLTDTITGK
ncbi:MAG: manganese-dependent inorganic pyrophosphatase [Tissierellia bacterium]|nr:manganese-dependent inorganic pyrophosphatase [Tissierellia bacterium]